MRRYSGKVFEHAFTNATPLYTSVCWDDALGDSDSIAICALADYVSAARGLTVAIEHSADGVNWIKKNATPEININTVSTGQSMTYGTDTSDLPNGYQARLRVALAAGKAKVRVYVTIRDRSESDTMISMTMALMMGRIKAAVASSMVRLGNSLKEIDKPIRDELASLFKEAKTQSDACKPAAPAGPSANPGPGEVAQIYVTMATCKPLQHDRLAYVYDHMSPRTRSALQAHVSEIIESAIAVFDSLVGHAASLLGIKVNLRELAELAFQGMLGASKGDGAARRPPPLSEGKGAPDGHFDDWSEASGRARYSAVDDVEEVPWDDGTSAYDHSEARTEMYAVQQEDWTTARTKSKRGAAHQELDQMLRRLPRDVDDQLFEMLYDWLVPQPKTSPGHGHHYNKLNCPAD